MKNLEGKVAVITGAASGIGKAMAERFARAQMKLVLVDIEVDALEATAADLRSQGTDVLTRIVDVADAEAMDALRDAVYDHFGTAHVICNNAGVAAAGKAWELTLADWEFTMRPNLWGVIHGIRVFGPRLIEQGEGHFVNTASMAGLVSMGNMAPYNVTKYGVVALSETLFEDLRAEGTEVGVSVLCPAFVNTKIWDSQRNRPAHLQNAPRPEKSAEYEAGHAAMKQIVESGIPAEGVADRVHDAVVNNELYILTHSATLPALEKRIGHILKGENPTPPGTPIEGLTQP
ncbi:MAG: SDR family NAD(P)-dependent oxidoreductase [Myxococcota bacterium]